MEIMLGIAIIYVIYLIIKQEKARAKSKKGPAPQKDVHYHETQPQNFVGTRSSTQDPPPRISVSNTANRPVTSSHNSQSFRKRLEQSNANSSGIGHQSQAFLKRRERLTGKSSNDDSESLAIFTISFGREEAKSTNNKKAQWIAPATSIKIKDKTITGGNFYLGGKLPSLDGWGVDAALVDDTLYIRQEPMAYEDDTLGYWPKFSSISAGCRGAFIDWLASKRNQDAPLGYVFIYFYGLERRVLVDAQNGEVNDSEFRDLFSEIQRLWSIYGDSNSFKNYSARLLEAMCILRPTVVSLDTDEFSNKYDALLFRYLLAKTVNAGAPITPKLALLWLQNSENYRFRLPARRCKQEFAELFEIKYQEKFGEGMVIKPNKTKLQLHYQAASSTLRGIKLNKEELPDPSSLKGPINKLIPIAEQCTDELESLSRYLAKKDASRDDITALLSLPDELSNEVNSPFIAKFKQWAESVLQVNNGIAGVDEFWSQIESGPPTKINKKEAELMSAVCAKAGLGIAPDVNFHHAKPLPDGKVIIFPTGHEKDFLPSKAFNEVAMVLRLGAMVATADDHVDENEVSTLSSLIDDDPNLSISEKRSLHAYLKWRLNSPTDFNGLKAKIENLNNKDKELISHILIGVALADGKVDPTEIKEIEKLYSKLGLERSRVTSDLHQYSSSLARTHKPKTQGAEQATSFSLNEELINLHESETQEVQGLLNSIFVDDESEPEDSASIEDVETIDDSMSLDASHESLLNTLISEEIWPRQAVEDLCQSLGLMIDGAIETINDWTFEVFDAPLLDDDGDIFVDQELVSEMQK